MSYVLGNTEKKWRQSGLLLEHILPSRLLNLIAVLNKRVTNQLLHPPTTVVEFNWFRSNVATWLLQVVADLQAFVIEKTTYQQLPRNLKKHAEKVINEADFEDTAENLRAALATYRYELKQRDEFKVVPGEGTSVVSQHLHDAWQAVLSEIGLLDEYYQQLETWRQSYVVWLRGLQEEGGVKTKETKKNGSMKKSKKNGSCKNNRRGHHTKQ